MILPGERETSLPKIIATIRALALGSSNALGRADLELSAGTETTVAAPLCVPGALISFAPLDAEAAAAGLYLKATGRASFVFGHAVGPAGRLVRYEVRRP